MVMFPLILSLSNSFISIPSIVIVPELISYILHIKLNKVLFPAPLLPTNATVSPAFTLKVVFFRTEFLS